MLLEFTVYLNICFVIVPSLLKSVNFYAHAGIMFSPCVRPNIRPDNDNNNVCYVPTAAQPQGKLRWP